MKCVVEFQHISKKENKVNKTKKENREKNKHKEKRKRVEERGGNEIKRKGIIFFSLFAPLPLSSFLFSLLFYFFFFCLYFFFFSFNQRTYVVKPDFFSIPTSLKNINSAVCSALSCSEKSTEKKKKRSEKVEKQEIEKK